MNRIVEIIAPRSWLDALLKGIMFILAVNLLDLVVTRFLQRLAYTVGTDLAPTTITAMPFIILAMLIMRHQRDLQEKLTLLATTDMLTGLPNRRAFLSRTAEVTRAGQTGALILLDADHFKKINDTFGHAVGDRCLTAIARHLQMHLRPGDLVGRFGGEEFSVFMPGLSVLQVMAVGDRLCQSIAVAEAVNGPEIALTLSAGTVFCDARTPLDKLLAMADAALYRAKAQGRARMVMWT